MERRPVPVEEVAVEDLTWHFARMATALLEADTLDDAMKLIVVSTVAVIDRCDHASISHTRRNELRSASSNDEVGPHLDRIQTETQQGPCLDAIRTGEPQTADDLATDPRWPAYGPRAVGETAVRSSLALPLVDRSRVVGALNLFSDRRATFDPGDEAQSALVAIAVAHATPALAAAIHRHDLEAALRTRDLIGQAKGMLMARAGMGDQQAFDVLVRASQRLNVKLSEVARQIVEGTLPRDAGPADQEG